MSIKSIPVLIQSLRTWDIKEGFENGGLVANLCPQKPVTFAKSTDTYVSRSKRWLTDLRILYLTYLGLCASEPLYGK